MPAAPVIPLRSSWTAVTRDGLPSFGSRSSVAYENLGVVALRAPGLTFDFVRADDAKMVKNRWHLDLASEKPTRTDKVTGSRSG